MSELVLGRGARSDVVLAAPSVSERHARLRREGRDVVIEDLGSSNGTWVKGERVTKAVVRVGDDVRLGTEPLPWEHPRIQALAHAGASNRTIQAMPRFGRYRCPGCQRDQILPVGFVRGELSCPSCGERLSFGTETPKPSALRTFFQTTVVAAVVSVGGATALFYAMPERFVDVPGYVGAVARARSEGTEEEARTPAVPTVESTLSLVTDPAGSPEEASIRTHAAPRIRDAIDPTSTVTRTLAVEVAAEDAGPFHVEQVARIWKHVRIAWRYVNDPQGTEYFSRASETITNGFAGDCDDFAILLSAMIGAIGGRTRVVLMDGPGGGHAYTEVCIDGPPNEVVQKIARFYRRSWDRRLGTRPAQPNVHHRVDASCPMWVNLDWTTNVIGGPYSEERYAVAVYPDGTTETLSPAPAPTQTRAPRAPTATALPQRERLADAE